MRAVAIIGHAADKFTPETEAQAREVIRGLLVSADVLVSGGCHLGGVDIFAEEEADALGVAKDIKLPATQSWADGYKPRNLAIADACTEAHSVVVADYPAGYDAPRYGARNGQPYCYHCDRNDHVKSGGCWTVTRALALRKPGRIHVIRAPEVQPEGSDE